MKTSLKLIEDVFCRKLKKNPKVEKKIGLLIKFRRNIVFCVLELYNGC